jgi:hypothetical protein
MEKRVTGILRFLRTVVLIDLGIFAVVGVVCWLGGWRTAYQYGNGLSLAGAAAIVIGLTSVVGGWGITRGSDYQYAQSVSEQDIRGRAQQAIEDVAQSFRFQIRMTAVGVVSIAAGALIQTLSR